LIELYEGGNFSEPKALIKAAAENLGKKKDIPKDG
jgi:hypothetical protein